MDERADATLTASQSDYSLFMFCMEGEGAAKDGLAITDNPYPAETDQCIAWRIGWSKTRSDLRFVQS
jgi:hypothetical protein